jgi:hypothetical protein
MWVLLNSFVGFYKNLSGLLNFEIWENTYHDF